MKKRVLCLFLVFVMLTALVPLYGAAESTEDPIITVTLDKDPVRRGERLQATVSITNADGTTEGLAQKYIDAGFVVVFSYSDGTPVTLYATQGNVGQTADFVFPVSVNTSLSSGTYKIIATKTVDGVTLRGEKSFTLSDEQVPPPDVSECTISLYFSPKNLHADDGFEMTATVKDKNGLPVENAVVEFHICHTDWSEPETPPFYGDYWWIWHTTNPDGESGILWTMQGKPGKYIAYACLQDNPDAFDYITFTYYGKATAKPTIKTQPKAVTVAKGSKATFKVAAKGGELSYQWFEQKKGSSSWKKISGATKATYSVKTTDKHNGNKYRCKVTNIYGSVTSKEVKLTVVTAKPTIKTHPASKTAAKGKSVTFTVKASGTALTYQWFMLKPGGKWVKIDGADSASYKVKAAAKLNGYQYRCKVTNLMGSVTSKAATLTVK